MIELQNKIITKFKIFEENFTTTEFKINIMDLCDICGGMYNAVEFLIKSKKIYEVEVFRIGKYELNFVDHYKINDKHNLKEGDNEGISCNIGNFSYGFLKKIDRNNIIFIFHNIDDNFFKNDMMQKYIEIRRKKEEIKIKMKDFDPYGEEDWENEKISIMKNFNEFVNESSDNDRIKDKLKKRSYDEESEENKEKLELRLSKTNLTEEQKDWVRKKMKRKKINPNDGNSNYDIIVPGAY